MQDLNASLVQCQLAWENPQDNRKQFADIIHDIPSATDLIVLPEMFTTGFSMNTLANAEEPGGETEHWLRDIARRHNCAVTGSIAVTTERPGFQQDAVCDTRAAVYLRQAPPVQDGRGTQTLRPR